MKNWPFYLILVVVFIVRDKNPYQSVEAGSNVQFIKAILLDLSREAFLEA